MTAGNECLPVTLVLDCPHSAGKSSPSMESTLLCIVWPVTLGGQLHLNTTYRDAPFVKIHQAVCL
jgi:hypothetical protein